jgi:hypothetical protein
MSHQAPTFAATRSPELPETQLRGWWLVIARAVVFIVIALTAVVGLVALPGLLPRFATPCADPLNTCLVGPQQVVPLARLGITPCILNYTR